MTAEIPASFENDPSTITHVPHFIIDRLADSNEVDTVANTIEAAYRDMCQDPVGQLEALETFAQDPSRIPEDSIWHKFTGARVPDTLIFRYTYDPDTMGVIEHDRIYTSLHEGRSGSPSTRGQEIRIQALRIFLNRLIIVHAAGRLPLKDVA